MGECSAMSMVTQRSVECHARGSFPFTAVLEIALSTRRACVLQMQSRRYLSPLLTKKCYCRSRGFCKSASQVVNILSCRPSLFTTCLAGVTYMGECRLSTMSMVTQRSVEGHARGSFLFTAFLEIALSTRDARVYCKCKVGDI